MYNITWNVAPAINSGQTLAWIFYLRLGLRPGAQRGQHGCNCLMYIWNILKKYPAQLLYLIEISAENFYIFWNIHICIDFSLNEPKVLYFLKKCR